MKNPLNRRFLRELKEDFGKYLALFLFLGMLIAISAGYFVANGSMITAYDESFEKYNIEDGNFETAQALTDEQIDTLEEDEAVTIYENAYIDEETKEVDSTLRIFTKRTEVDLECLMEGEFPTETDEIAIDRMYADNNDLAVGDVLTVAGKELTVTGLVALSDYSALFSNSSDMMFDAQKFGVAVMTADGFDALDDTHLHYSYSWVYDTAPSDDAEAKEMAEDFMEPLAMTGLLENFIPEYSNQAIHFTGDDMKGDNSIMAVFLYIVIAIIAFVMAITTSSTIVKEATVIGTLRATGCSRGELVRHYMTLPMLVLLLAALIGNILGYSVLKEYMAAMYYGSYSLPTYVTLWNADAFVKTTVVPLVLMFFINLVVLESRLRLSPLRFLRRDLTVRRKKKSFRLNTKIPIFTRFGLRVIFQNIPNYATVFIGTLFAVFILLFGLMFTPLLDKYADDIIDNMVAEYQYVLKTQVETDDADAEKYAVTTLLTTDESRLIEDVTIYGVEADSAYISLPGSGNYVSSAYAKKYGLSVGDTVTLKEEYEDKTYTFTVNGVYDYMASLAIFMDRESFEETFDQDEGYFNGYFSNRKLSDLDEKLVATVITEDDLTKTTRQLKLSMGSLMNLFLGFGVMMFLLIIYLLSKIVVEKNTVSISMTKILGYNNPEINRLYMMPTTAVVLLSLLLSIPLSDAAMGAMCSAVFAGYAGYFPYYVPESTYVKIFAMGAVSYAVVALLLMKKIRRIPMGEALKNVE